MAETPDEVYDRVLAEEQSKGSSPAVAEARAKAARHRARKGLPTDPAGAAAAESAAKPAAQAPAAEAEPPAPMAETEAPAAEAEAVPAAQTIASAVATAEPPRGRGAAARAARAAAGGNGDVPDRIQRLLAVVKPESIQRVEREPIDRVNVWPHLMASELLSMLVVTLGLLLFSGAPILFWNDNPYVNAPFRELANINKTPNPSKAPWYFLGLQELLRYFHPQVAGVTIPQWIILGLIAAPYIDRNPSTKPEDRKVAIVMFTIFFLFFAVLVIIGSIFRGPGFNWIYPWDTEIIRIFEL